MKYFIPYKQAVALKKLGFNEPCFATYIGETFDSSVQFQSDDYFTAAPLFSQAFRFFREKYNIVFYVNMVACDNFYFVIHLKLGVIDNPDDLFISQHMETNEEAELACINKILELVN